MKVSDFIVKYLIEQNISDVFGYPGGMVTHLMDSFSKYSDRINAHVTYHEQGAAFAACGYAQSSGKVGVAYATSGPGATNLLTGIANAYFDSIPTVFITGQVNTFESSGTLGVRQRGFQETDIVSIAKPITKKSVYVDDAAKIKEVLDDAFSTALSGRKGPVLLDIPMNIFRAEIDDVEVDLISGATSECTGFDEAKEIDVLKSELKNAKRPCFLIGNGVKTSGIQDELTNIIGKWKLPVVTSMIAFDALNEYKYKYGFIGAYGDRSANFVVAKSDLVIALGSRMDIRQVGATRKNFAKDAKIIRFDIDAGELQYKVHEDEIQINIDLKDAVHLLENIEPENDYSEWIDTCETIKSTLAEVDVNNIKSVIKEISHCVPENSVVTTDVGQNQVWVAQSFDVKKQKILFSGGHGAMGYSLPAAIGAFYATGDRAVAITGDGGLQMNIQELQYLSRERIPVKVVVLNNDALGMIRHFQEMYFDSNYFQTKPEGGFSSPSFNDIATAYNIPAVRYHYGKVDYNKVHEMLNNDDPALIEIYIDENTHVFPKLEFGKPNQDQEPLLDRDVFDRLMNL